MSKLKDMAMMAEALSAVDIVPKHKAGDSVDVLIDGKPVKVKVVRQKGDYMEGTANGRTRLYWYAGNDWVNKT